MSRTCFAVNRYWLLIGVRVVVLSLWDLVVLFVLVWHVNWWLLKLQFFPMQNSCEVLQNEKTVSTNHIPRFSRRKVESNLRPSAQPPSTSPPGQSWLTRLLPLGSALMPPPPALQWRFLYSFLSCMSLRWISVPLIDSFYNMSNLQRNPRASLLDPKYSPISPVPRYFWHAKFTTFSPFPPSRSLHRKPTCLNACNPWPIRSHFYEKFSSFASSSATHH